MQAYVKRKLPTAPEPTRAAYKKPVVDYGKYVEVKELKAVIPKPLPFPKPSEERKAKIEERKKERKEREKNIWTPERTEKLIELFNKRMAYSDIAEAMGLTLYSINHQIHKLQGDGVLKKKANTSPWTPAETTKLLRLRGKGLTFKEIGERLGRSENVCGSHYRSIKRG